MRGTSSASVVGESSDLHHKQITMHDTWNTSQTVQTLCTIIPKIKNDNNFAIFSPPAASWPWNNNNNHDNVYGAIIIGRVHPVHLMNVNWVPVAAHPQTKRNDFGLCVHWKLAATIHIYHWRLLLLLSWWSFYCPWRAEGWVDLTSINYGIHCAHISNLSIKKWILNFKCVFSIYTVPLWNSSAMF